MLGLEAHDAALDQDRGAEAEAEEPAADEEGHLVQDGGLYGCYLCVEGVPVELGEGRDFDFESARHGVHHADQGLVDRGATRIRLQTQGNCHCIRSRQCSIPRSIEEAGLLARPAFDCKVQHGNRAAELDSRCQVCRQPHILRRRTLEPLYARKPHFTRPGAVASSPAAQTRATLRPRLQQRAGHA